MSVWELSEFPLRQICITRVGSDSRWAQNAMYSMHKVWTVIWLITLTNFHNTIIIKILSISNSELEYNKASHWLHKLWQKANLAREFKNIHNIVVEKPSMMPIAFFQAKNVSLRNFANLFINWPLPFYCKKFLNKIFETLSKIESLGVKTGSSSWDVNWIATGIIFLSLK